MITRIVRRLSEGRRRVGITEFRHTTATWPVVVPFALVTPLDDVRFLFRLGDVFYVVGEHTQHWVLDRRRWYVPPASRHTPGGRFGDAPNDRSRSPTGGSATRPQSQGKP
ncbi:hypothetical protein [Salinigranum sp. GCM10025319]|uniref:hypothetical protein n=1 Tax=Salinigranum sp. GCM10025319 TaxID=3252687 RepID=UPI00361770EA